jgi:hypothetical protein
LPNDEVDCRLLAKDCRNSERLVELPVPPRSATRLLKLVCSELSAEEVALVLVLEEVELEPVESVELPLVKDAIRL